MSGHSEHAIAKVLRSWGIHRGFPEHRKSLAHKLAGAGRELTDQVAKVLFLEAKDMRGAERPAALVASWLEDGSWEELYGEIRESMQHVQQTAGPQRPGDLPARAEPIDREREKSRRMILADVRRGITAAAIAKTYGWSIDVVLKAIDVQAKADHECTGAEFMAQCEAEREAQRKRGRARMHRKPATDDEVFA